MSRKLIVSLIALSFLAVGVSFAAVENIKVSGDINSEVVSRNLGLNDDGNLDQENFLFTQVRLRFDADLTEGVSAVVRLLNERVWGDEDQYGDNSEINLDLGYIELKEFLYQPLTVMVGRQNLRYGNALIIGDPDTNRLVGTTGLNNVNFADLSLRKSFDAAKAILDFAPFTVDLVYAVVSEKSTNKHDDVSLAGTNVAYDWSSYNGITEAYAWFVTGLGSRATSAGYQNNENEDNAIVLGARTQFDPTDKITLGIEGAWQGGDYSTSATSQTLHRNAWAGQFKSEYRFLNKYNSKLGLGYTYLSGDNNDSVSGSSNDYKGWDPLFEDQTPAEIINILIPNSNAHYITLTGSMMPREDITLGLNYTHARLANNYTSSTLSSNYPTILGTSTTGSNSYLVRTNEKDLGDEVDIYAIYDYTEDVQLKLVSGWFMPGKVFDSTNDNNAYSARAGVTVDF